MIDRILSKRLEQALQESPAVVLLGSRQVGKTTLALLEGKKFNAIYLDLESAKDLAKLQEPELFFEGHQHRLVILDEVHRMPGLFPILRGIIDQLRRDGITFGQFLLLGTASLDLLQQSGESLVGRVSYLELDPINILEIAPTQMNDLWVRGGFPDSFLSSNPQKSFRWRDNFIRTYLEREIPQFGPRIAA